jgi:hypothetical protein
MLFRRTLLLVAALTVGSTGTPAEEHAKHFDILGVKLGMTAEVARKILDRLKASNVQLDKGWCVAQQIAIKSGNASSERGAEKCVKTLRGNIDEITTLEIEFLEDLPARPNVSVVTSVTLEYKYEKDKGPPQPLLSEYLNNLTKKYGAPLERMDRPPWTWGSPYCRNRHNPERCAMRGEFVEFQDGTFRDTLKMADPGKFSGMRTAIQKALKEARTVAVPKF